LAESERPIGSAKTKQGKAPERFGNKRKNLEAQCCGNFTRSEAGTGCGFARGGVNVGFLLSAAAM
jgi:hypothetical protein